MNFKRMLATKMAATGTRVMSVPAGGKRQRMIARSFLQNKRSTRLSAVYIPGVARDVVHLFHAAIVRRMKAVIHARGESQRRELAVAIVAREFRIAEKIRQGICEALGLQHRALVHLTAGTHQCVAGTRQKAGIHLDRPRSVRKFAREAVVQAGEAGFLCVRQIEVGEHPPQR
jgi:hypothetical protein